MVSSTRHQRRGWAHILVGLSLMLASIGCANAQSAVVEIVVTNGGALVYSQKDRGSPVVGRVHEGARLTAAAASKEWLLVVVHGTRGFIEAHRARAVRRLSP